MPFLLDARLLERLIGQRGDGLDVLARRDLRHDAAVERVQVGLRRDGVGEDFAPVLDDCDGSLVAGGLESENFIAAPPLLPRRIPSS